MLFHCSHLHIHQWRAHSSGGISAGNHQKQHVCCRNFCHCEWLSSHQLSLAQCMPAHQFDASMHLDALMLDLFLHPDCLCMFASFHSGLSLRPSCQQSSKYTFKVYTTSATLVCCHQQCTVTHCSLVTCEFTTETVFVVSHSAH